MKRFTKKLIYSKLVFNLFASFFTTLMIMVMMISEVETEKINSTLIKLFIIIGLGIYILIYLILGIYSILYYKTSSYELGNKEVICKRGVLFKKKSIIEYHKIHAINSKQNIIDKLFKVSTLQLDSGSTNTSHSAEIQIIEEEDIIKNLINKIKKIQNNEQCDDIKEVSSKENITNVYNFDSKLKVIYSLLSSFSSFIVFIIALFVGVIVLFVLYVTAQLDMPIFLLYLIIAFLIVVFLSAIQFGIMILISIIKYYNFKLYRDKNNIEINYGLLNIVKNTFKYDKIKAIRIEQGIVKRLFGYATVKIEVIGYTIQSNNESNNIQTGILIPLCRFDDVNDILKNILPNYIPSIKKYKPKYFLPFYSLNLFLTFIILSLVYISSFVFVNYFVNLEIAIIVLLSLIALTAFILAFLFIQWKLEYNNQGIGIEDNKISIYKGGFKKEIVIIWKKHITGIDTITTHYRRKKEIYSYKIHFKTNAQSNTLLIKCLDRREADDLLSLLTY